MRVLQVHNRYQQKGGEDVVVEREATILADHGHDVLLHSVDNSTIAGPLAKTAAALSVCYSRVARDNLYRDILSFRPDIVHFHNIFPRVTPSAFDACRQAGVPVVHTLHNFRLLCPGALFLRDGKVCEDCVAHHPYRSVLRRCYRNSFLGTFVVARMISHHGRRQTWREKVDAFIAVTEFARSKFVDAGFPADLIHVKPNPVFPPVSLPAATRAGALFVGRLSPEKGVNELLAAWRAEPFPLKIAGSGPLASSVTSAASPLLEYVGEISSERVAEAMAEASFLVVPSVCYEGGSPLVVVEAFANGLPVIAARLGSMAESVTDGMTGLHFEPGNAGDLARKVMWALQHPDRMTIYGANARAEYFRKYHPSINCSQLIDIYSAAALRNRNRSCRH